MPRDVSAWRFHPEREERMTTAEIQGTRRQSTGSRSQPIETECRDAESAGAEPYVEGRKLRGARLSAAVFSTVLLFDRAVNQY
jgi:hypothetical protein